MNITPKERWWNCSNGSLASAAMVEIDKISFGSHSSHTNNLCDIFYWKVIWANMVHWYHSFSIELVFMVLWCLFRFHRVETFDKMDSVDSVLCIEFIKLNKKKIKKENSFKISLWFPFKIEKESDQNVFKIIKYISIFIKLLFRNLARHAIIVILFRK